MGKKPTIARGLWKDHNGYFFWRRRIRSHQRFTALGTKDENEALVALIDLRQQAALAPSEEVIEEV